MRRIGIAVAALAAFGCARSRRVKDATPLIEEAPPHGEGRSEGAGAAVAPLPISAEVSHVEWSPAADGLDWFSSPDPDRIPWRRLSDEDGRRVVELLGPLEEHHFAPPEGATWSPAAVFHHLRITSHTGVSTVVDLVGRGGLLRVRDGRGSLFYTYPDGNAASVELALRAAGSRADRREQD